MAAFLLLVTPSVAYAEDRGRQMDPGSLDFVYKLGAQARWSKPTNDLAFFITALFKDKNIGHGDDIAFHSADLGDSN